MDAPIEHADPATLWKEAMAFARKEVSAGLRPQWISPSGKESEANAYVVRPPQPPPSTVVAKLRRKLCHRPPFIYTHFRWQENGEWQQISRSDLCAAYLRLCEDYNGLRLALSGLERLARDNDKVTVEKELACRTRFRRELEVIRERGSRYLPRLKWAVGYMASYLTFLCRCEDHNAHPPISSGMWERYSKPITEGGVRLHDKLGHRRLFWSGNMDDYPFRAAMVVNRTETPEGVQVLRKEIERLALEVLRFRDCEYPETNLHQYIPANRKLPSSRLPVATALDTDSKTQSSKSEESGVEAQTESLAPPAYKP
ncbi:hypothetical protein A1Q2_00271 [Trichosporon asahii var. asahii CBS 8904]|uniref:Uncharacterized protein n=1 Tax=Trichosporon asahii var. asahii (strain CBS 8904) TaxID=1220162 RepID=K1VMT0_TRIAC|nr:hypothetical protein A1Q2_00271 [Trichosporon asahii var. asahii CBS 8904]